MESIQNALLHLPSELNLVIYAACVYSDKDEERLTRHLGDHSSDVDWEKFILLADTRHRVAAPVYKNLSHYGNGQVPKTVMARLKNIAGTRRAMMLVKTGELIRIVKMLNENSINVLALKGPALSMQLHNDPCMRFSTDLDIVVQMDQVEKVDVLLKQAGYIRQTPNFELTLKQTQAFLNKNHHFGYMSSAGQIKLELHWKLTKHENMIPDLKFDNIWQQKQYVCLGGMDIPILSPAHTISFLSVHGSSHMWYRLIWLHDMITVLNKYEKKVDWDNIVATAMHMGIERMVVQGILLGSSAADMEVPSPAVLHIADADHRIQDLCQISAKALSNENDRALTSIAKAQYYRSKLHGFLLFKSWSYKFQYIKDHMTTISADWTYFSLPDRLFFLYHFARPFLWLYRRFKPYENPKIKSIKPIE